MGFKWVGRNKRSVYGEGFNGFISYHPETLRLFGATVWSVLGIQVVFCQQSFESFNFG